MFLKPILDSNVAGQGYYYLLASPIPQWDKYKEEITQLSIEKHLENYDPDFGFNVRLHKNAHPIIPVLYKEFEELCRFNFDNIAIDPRNPGDLWAYVQNKEHYNSVWHNHKRTATINAVWYPKLPDSSAKLEVRDGEGTIPLNIQEGFIYVFPYWMDHRPLPNKTVNDWRVSINIELLTNTRVIHKESRVMW